MREILFRGKGISGFNNGKFVYGYLLIDFWGSGYCGIRPIDTEQHGGYVEVDQHTVGQFTGLTDRNGKKIFEGDVVKGHWGTILIVFYDNISASFRVKTLSGSEREPSYYSNESYPFEIIGNIHDNPELLKGGDER